MTGKHILVVDDERSIREFLSILLEREGYETTTAETMSQGIELLKEQPFDLVICDLKLPDGSGFTVLHEALKLRPDTEFIIITAHTTPQLALESLRAGAAEYISKPFDVEDLKLIVRKLLGGERTGEPAAGMVDFVGSGAAMQRILDLVPRVAATPSTVLITGESGTGKELLARAIHAHSPRATAPFLTVNCGAVPEGLLESELFGHVRGAFTGAVRDHVGLFPQATGGTLFLDEIGELTPTMQVKLLRVLQEHCVRPVGGQREQDVDVRILAATNRELQVDAESGRFREDLYYRINVIHLHLPPLRHRRGDIPDLARHFAVKTCARFNVTPKRLTPDAIRVLQAYPWPGNVRELENVIERSVALETSEVISSGSLPPHLSGSTADDATEDVALPEEGLDLEEYLDGVRRSLIRQALARTGGQQKRAAELLRLSYRALRYHAAKLGLTPDVQEDEQST